MSSGNFAVLPHPHPAEAQPSNAPPLSLATPTPQTSNTPINMQHLPNLAPPLPFMHNLHPTSMLFPTNPSMSHSSQSQQSSQLESANSMASSRKRKRNGRKEKGLESFRNALLDHLEKNATILSSQDYDPNNSSSNPPIVTDEQRRQWLEEYSERIQNYSIKQLVKESVKYRFQCAYFIILVPNWHALREALWAHLKRMGIRKAKRSVSTKEDLVAICIQDHVRFDFSDFVKDADSHGNRKKKKSRKIRPLTILPKRESLLPGTAENGQPLIQGGENGQYSRRAADMITQLLTLPPSELKSFQSWWNRYTQRLETLVPPAEPSPFLPTLHPHFRHRPYGIDVTLPEKDAMSE